MSDITEHKDEDWEENEESAEVEVEVEVVDEVEIEDEIDGLESANVMQFSDYVEADEKKIQKTRITELRRRAEERQDWKRISDEYDWEFDKDDALEEA